MLLISATLLGAAIDYLAPGARTLPEAIPTPCRHAHSDSLLIQ